MKLAAAAMAVTATVAAQAQAATTATLDAQSIVASPSPGCQPKALWGAPTSTAGSLAAGTYRYAVTATTTSAPPACPSIPVVLPASLVVALQWNATPGTTGGYTVYRGTSDANLAPITASVSCMTITKCVAFDSGAAAAGSPPTIAGTSLAAGDHTDMSIIQKVDYGGMPNDNSDDPTTNNPADPSPPALKTDVIHFPGGLVANAQSATATCAVSAAGPSLLGSLALHGRNDPNEDLCPSASLVGSVQALNRTPLGVSLVQGDVYVGTPLAGEPERLLIALRPLCSFHNPVLAPNSSTCNGMVGANNELDTEYLAAKGSVVERSPGVNGTDFAAFDISSGTDQPLPATLPRRDSAGTQVNPALTIQVRSLTPTLFGYADQGTAVTTDDKPFVTLPTCGVTEFAADKTTYADSTGTTVSFPFTSFPACPEPPVTPSTSDAAAAGAPSNAFSLGKLKGTTLAVNVASAGKVEVRQAGALRSGASASAKKKLLKPSSASGGPGTVKVKLKLTAAAKKTLKQKHRLKLKAMITFTPTGGTAASKTAVLKFKSAG